MAKYTQGTQRIFSRKVYCKIKRAFITLPYNLARRGHFGHKPDYLGLFVCI